MTYSLRTDCLFFLLITMIFSFKTISLNAQNKSTESCPIEIDNIIIINQTNNHMSLQFLLFFYSR